ncbi:ROK family protein [Demequina lutea]|uniref:Glucokinase n=1 Tax=Demequina lutea TaxID=431489 RepID=A0A7Y9ZCK7_9MICO|nr:ROK family protein [Demequina lutea]NYI42867.1 glucokinase [Demequina lutea]
MTVAVAAVDLGGTRLRAAVVDSHGNILRRAEALTAHDLATPEQIPSLIREVVAGDNITRAVIGLPGRIDRARRRLGFARNLPIEWLAYLNEEWLSSETGLDVSLGGDAELAAVGEAYFGAGVTEGDTAYLTFSTGVGAAALSGGRLLATHRTGFQIGLIPQIPMPGKLIDTLVSGRQIEAFFRTGGYGAPSVQALLHLVDQGDVGADQLWESIVRHASWVAVLMCHVVCPDVLVVGGGLSNAGWRLLSPMDDALRHFGPQELEHPIRLTTCARGDDAALAGAAAWHVATTASEGTLNDER